MLRINSINDLVVPPFECAWLLDEKLQLQNEEGCIDFEVKGETDATIIFKASPGSRRWQHVFRAGDGTDAALLSTEQHYIIILGSHRNSSLKVEKNGQACHMVSTGAACELSAARFQRFWISFQRGGISVGKGVPGSSPLLQWQDDAPAEGMRHIGLAAWDKFLAYRNVQLQRAVPKHQLLTVPESDADGEAGEQPPSLADLCARSIVGCVEPETVCTALQAVAQLEPALDSLAPPLLSYLAANLEAVLAVRRQDFARLPAATLVRLLGSPSLECQELRLHQAVADWALAAPAEEREAALTQLLPLIRFPSMSREDLEVVAAGPFSDLPLLQELVAEARSSFDCSTSGRPEQQAHAPPRGAMAVEGRRLIRRADPLAAARWQRRRSAAATELMFLYAGDANGVCHHLGTDYERGPFVNPVLAGRLQVSASSPSCRLTDPKGVVSGALLRANAAGPRRRDGAVFWQADLGPGHRLMCNYYTLRHDASPHYPRSWVLQASNNGEDWVDLRRHLDDAAINMAGQYGSWPVGGHAACRPFRIFRLLLLGPPAGAAPGQPTRALFPLSYMEFYGYFYRVSKDE